MIMIKSHQFTTLRGTTEEGNLKKRRLPIKVDDAIYQVIAFIHKTIPVILKEFKECATKLTS